MAERYVDETKKNVFVVFNCRPYINVEILLGIFQTELEIFIVLEDGRVRQVFAFVDLQNKMSFTLGDVSSYVLNKKVSQ